MKKAINKKNVLLFCALILCTCSVIYVVTSFTREPKVSGSIITIPVNRYNPINSDKIVIQVCNENIIKVHYMPKGKSTPNTQVIGKENWDASKAAIDIKTNPMTIKTDNMLVNIDKKTYRISIYDSKGKMLLKEQDIEDIYNEGVAFNHEGGENFYGINGYNATESVKGILRNTGKEVKAGEQGHCGGPFVWSTTGFGLLVDSDGGAFKINDKEVEFTDSSKKDTAYYVMVGKPIDIMSSLAEISGKPPMFPKWAMGFTNSEWGIDQKELTDVVDTYRKKNIPIDNYTLDFDWKAWGEDNYGEFRWNDTKFPDGTSGKLKEIMEQKGIKLTGITKPRIHVDTTEGKYLEDHKLWLEDKAPAADYFSKKLTGDVDFSKEEARTWFFDHSKDALDSGIQGWWNDEADSLSPNFQFLNMQRALYEGQRKYNNNRVWSINRNYYLGAQKYAYGMWSGDINTGFYPMIAQRDRMLSAINLGQVKWGMDTGGFNGGNPEPQNYARWVEFSAFTPMFRVHGNNGQQRQPWVFGETAEAAAKKAIQLRYKLIPYIYSYERRAYENGIGLVKPLMYDYPEDKNTQNNVDSWMFGDHLLVSPVVNENETSKDIYLPKGTWIDYFKGTKYEGGQTIKYAVNGATWDDIPLFIKEGAIIPSQDVMNYVGEKPLTNIYIDAFPSNEKTEFNYYDDDGATYNYEKGEYLKQNIWMQDKDNGIEINLEKNEGSFKSETKYYILKVHGKSTKNVELDNKSIKTFADYNNLITSEEEGTLVGQDNYGSVTYIKVKTNEAKQLVVK